MGLLERVLKMDAVYWEPAGVDAYGKPSLAAPTALKVFWIDTAELFTDDEGEEQTSKARVMVGQDVKVNGWLWLGAYADLPSGASTTPHEVEAMPIKQFRKVPDIKVSKYLRQAIL